MTINLIILALLSILSGGTPDASHACDLNTLKIYPTVMQVYDMEVEEEETTVTLINANGDTFSYITDTEEAEQLAIYDLMALTMCDNGTPDTIYDDIILDVNYVGYAQLWEEVQNY